MPKGLRLQEFDNTAWLGLVPFRMAGLTRRGLPDFPPISSFPELNLRTYVECDGKPGVWFFSLDAASLPIVIGGRYLYGLPYRWANMRQRWIEGWHYFQSNRWRGKAKFQARYRPVGDVFFPAQGTFEHWLSERYCLYSHSRRHGLQRLEVHHAPWPLQKAEVVIQKSTILSVAGMTPLDENPVCHFSSGVDVVAFNTHKIPGPSCARGYEL